MIIDNFKYKLFGRFKGRKKSKQISFNNYKVSIKDDIDHRNFNILDIGSGSGENALFLSNFYSNAKVITCELFEDGNINLFNSIQINKIDNIRLFNGNVLEFLDKLNHFLIFDQIWILFPDPWPKKRHHKRRLINSSFLKKVHLYIKNSGKLMIASDSQSYIQSILEIIYDVKEFYCWKNQRVAKWNYSNLELPRTKFYRKAEKSNRNTMIFKLRKI
jgi:tRNA (guanine-N7-)-methyltransferase